MRAKSLLLLILLLVGCEREDKRLLAKLEQKLQPVRTMTRGYHILTFDSLTDFNWDRMYPVIGTSYGGNTDNLISHIIGFKWSGPDIPIGSKRLLFVHQHKVVAYIDCSQSNTVDGRVALPIELFRCSDEQVGYSRRQARFAVFRNCAGGLPGFFYMVPLDCLEDFRVSIKQGCTDSTLKILAAPRPY
jgi:hypothetical protein